MPTSLLQNCIASQAIDNTEKRINLECDHGLPPAQHHYFFFKKATLYYAFVLIKIHKTRTRLLQIEPRLV